MGNGRFHRRWHANLGLFSALTLGAIALSCFFFAHRFPGDPGKALKDIHTGKFLPENLRWVWIDSQGLLLGYLIVSGYLMHRRSRRPAVSVAPEGPGSLLVLYGSQTGNAQSVAARLGRVAEAAGFGAHVLPMDSWALVDSTTYRRLAVVTSTTGDGEFPDHARAFWAHLSTLPAGAWAGLEYAVLGLGDRSYPEFCRAGREFDRRLEELGATRVLPRVDADADFEGAASAWIRRLVERMQAERGDHPLGSTATSDLSSVAVSAPRPNSAPTAPEPVESAASGFGRENPYAARLVRNRRLTSPDSGKEVRHFEIDLADSGLTYVAGDALGIRPTNCPELVESTLQALRCDGEEAVVIGGAGEISLRRALQRHVDLTRPTEDLVRSVAERARDAGLQAALAQADFRTLATGREVIDYLIGWPAARFTPEEFVARCRALQPRLYSIASSPKAHPSSAHLTVSVVRYEAHGWPRKGVCSTFLADRARSITPVPVFVQTAAHFRLPADATRPVLMIGPGTGIAPFRGFLQDRAAAGAAGRHWLFFGDQRAETDFLYRDEILRWRDDGLLTRLDLAFSRDQPEKIYVQHRLRERGAEVWRWLQDGAHLYVCGDARRMARDVDDALAEIVRMHGGLDEDAARAHLADLRAAGRYQRDVY